MADQKWSANIFGGEKMSKRSKRRSGEGGWFYDEARQRYRLRITYYDELERMHQKDFFGLTQREASEKARSFRAKLNRDTTNDVAVPTLKVWITTYLTQYAVNRVRPRTLEKYKSTLKYVVEAFGDTTLSAINPVDLQCFLTELQEKGGTKGTGLSSSTVRAVRRYLIGVLDVAVEAELIKKNPARATKAPRNKERGMIILSKKQAKELITQAGLVDSEYYSNVLPVLLKLTMHTGLRQG